MAIERPPPFTPQQRIDNAFDFYPNAQLDAAQRTLGQRMRQNPGYMDIASALRGPQNPMFAVPPHVLQRMAGDVVEPDPMRFSPNMYTDDYWKRVSQPAGYVGANPNAIIQGHAQGKVKVLPVQPK